jgi:hypothetical protein
MASQMRVEGAKTKVLNLLLVVVLLTPSRRVARKTVVRSNVCSQNHVWLGLRIPFQFSTIHSPKHVLSNLYDSNDVRRLSSSLKNLSDLRRKIPFCHPDLLTETESSGSSGQLLTRHLSSRSFRGHSPHSQHIERLPAATAATLLKPHQQQRRTASTTPSSSSSAAAVRVCATTHTLTRFAYWLH